MSDLCCLRMPWLLLPVPYLLCQLVRVYTENKVDVEVMARGSCSHEAKTKHFYKLAAHDVRDCFYELTHTHT